MSHFLYGLAALIAGFSTGLAFLNSDSNGVFIDPALAQISTAGICVAFIAVVLGLVLGSCKNVR
jgi:hypothetical protein